MYVTSNYVGTTIGGFRYLFLALYEDYNDFNRDFVKEFNIHLERMARDLRDKGAVVKPFLGDVETVRSGVLEKDWTPDQRAEISKVPGLLVISKDFHDFSPTDDSWAFFHFSEERYGSSVGVSEMSDLMKEIVEIARQPKDPPGQMYALAREAARELPSATKIFDVSPSVFGVSIDLTMAGHFLVEWLRERKRSVGRPDS